MVQHAVLNSSQDNQLSLRTGISAAVTPNVMNFSSPPPPRDSYVDDLRETLDMAPDERIILQPTRVVQRKGIEHAIELVHRLSMKGMASRLVITHASGDEGDEYSVRVREYSELLGVRTSFCSDIVCEKRSRTEDGRKRYTLADLYQEADLVTYPSTIEGFGNAFLEAIYFKRPIMVNNYSIYHSDIAPKGFRTIQMDEYVSEDVVDEVHKVLTDTKFAESQAEHNYALGQRFFSYEVLQQELRTLLMNCFGT